MLRSLAAKQSGSCVSNSNTPPPLTIGQLAKRAGVSTSSLRYYEEQGLLKPSGRTAAGYRLYGTSAETTLTFIQRAQRLGFSLADIRLFLDRLDDQSLLDATVVEVAEQRFLEIERQLTERLVLRHELETFLIDLRQRADPAGSGPSSDIYRQLVERVCDHDQHRRSARSTLDWLLSRSGCALARLDEEQILKNLRGQHVHVWRDGDAYHILIPTRDPVVIEALQEMARLESDCHAHGSPSLEEVAEGYQLTARGENAFLFARIFLALEEDA